MTLPLISGYTAALIALFQLGLMMAVGLARRSEGIAFGDGGNGDLLKKIRRHGNLTENAPIFLLLLGFLELSGGSEVSVVALASLFVTARFSHAYALSGKDASGAARGYGVAGTLLSIAGASIALAWQLFGLA